MSTPFVGAALALRGAVRIVHHVPGRLRVRVDPSALRAGISLAGLRTTLERTEGVRALRISPASLSAVIEYNPGRLAPGTWETLIHGSDSAARAVLNHLGAAGRPAEGSAPPATMEVS